jgi:D-proline reductase (dithiol) PrdB
MPRLEELDANERERFLNWPCIDNYDSPWTPMIKKLSDSKVALVTTAGLHVRGDKPFLTGRGVSETSYRIIPRKTAHADILQSHSSIGFDRSNIYRDLNISFPVDRLNELLDSGQIGSLSDKYYSFMGALVDRDVIISGIVEDSAPKVAAMLIEENVDVVLMTPT